MAFQVILHGGTAKPNQMELLETEHWCPCKVHTCNLIPNVMILGGGAFRSDKFMRIEPSQKELEPSYRRDPTELLDLSTMREHSEKTAIYELRNLLGHPVCRHLDLGHPRLHTVRNQFILFISSPPPPHAPPPPHPTEWLRQELGTFKLEGLSQSIGTPGPQFSAP